MELRKKSEHKGHLQENVKIYLNILGTLPKQYPALTFIGYCKTYSCTPAFVAFTNVLDIKVNDLLP